MPALLTIANLETFLHRTIGAKDLASAQASIDTAIAHVHDVLGFDIMGDAYAVAAPDIALARAVGVRIAAQDFTNPEDRQSYSGPEGLSYVSSPQVLSKIMSDADRKCLLGIQLRYAPGFG